jgi:hypothetical protein
MKTFYVLAGQFHLVAALLFLFLTNSRHAQSVEVLRLPFLFSEDENLDQTELNKAIPRSKELQSDTYLNAPMTRLEYMLSRLEATLNTNPDLIREYLSRGFEYSEAKSINSFARYSREDGRITVGYRIDLVGRPTKPMRSTCEDFLFRLGLAAPQANLGYLMHHATLGVLAHEDFDKYTSIMATLAKNIVHRVILHAEGSKGTYGLACQRTGKEAPIQYNRYSF